MKKFATTVVLFMVALFAFGQGDQASSGIPAYNSDPPQKGNVVPPILSKDALWGPAFQFEYQSRAYELASRVSSVIYQQPCYCHCDRMGHTSLHSCFESTHAAECGVCLKELYYTYKESRLGRSPSRIRRGIIEGEWKQIDLQTPNATR